DGKYDFMTQSDDGSRLSIDGKKVVDNGGVHPPELKNGSIELKAGDHKLLLEFFQGGGGAECILGWKVPGGKRETIPAKALSHAKGADKIEYDKVAWEKLPKGMAKTEGNAKIGANVAQAGNAIHEKMDYGPFLTGSVESSYPAGGNYAIKGLAIRIGDKKQASIAFDTEMLRYSVGWTGDWLKLDYGRDGLEGHPTLRGLPRFGTKGNSIGWANKDGKWDDTRQQASGNNGRHEGPLAADWGRYKGVYLDGRDVILHYTVGDADVLEQPTFDDSDGFDVFARTFRIGKTAKPLTMLVAEDDKAEAASYADKNLAGLAVKMHFKERKAAPKPGEESDDSAEDNVKDAFISTAISGGPDGLAFALDGKRILLKIPALTEPANFTLKICAHPVADKSKFATLAAKKVATLDFDKVTKSGGAPRWKPIEVKGTPAKADDAAYVIDTITIPVENEYNAYMRITGIDFFKDGRAAVCTMSGDVWVISGIDKTLDKITWRRYATGLFASLGLKIVDDQVYTLGRDQITRFYDLNNDGEADYYECFNNDCTVGPDYHEFAHDLHTDSKGDFYYMKGSNLGTAGGKYHGTMVHVSKDGSKSDIYCYGFRAPNGMCVGPHDEITNGDNQGNWTPSSPINWIKKGGFYGFQLDQYPYSKKGPRLNPLCWVPYEEDNSCGGQVWSGANWGPLSNTLLHMSYGKCKLFSVLIEKYDDDNVQGGVVKFPLSFDSGIMRARLNPTDGQLYFVGMRGWQTSAPQIGCVQRVRYTGKNYYSPLAAKIANNGMSITFAQPLDKASAEDASSWDVRRFNIHYTGAYGSEEYSVEDDTKHHKEGARDKRDVVDVKSAKLDADGKTVKLELASVKLCTNMIVSFNIKAADGTKLKQDLDYTVNFIPGGEKSPGMFPPEAKKKVDPKTDPKKDTKA
ncbi:MAG TPA: DUF6797 domain-containing protein, partial [Planctomycetota bacterium]|nr:DUF6797 domain-containing protein [Planctomycetota bacterium]